jgi:hypothetical protein
MRVNLGIREHRILVGVTCHYCGDGGYCPHCEDWVAPLDLLSELIVVRSKINRMATQMLGDPPREN